MVALNGMAASAAYWLASQSEKVYAGPMDVVGSIGVYMVIMDDSERMEKAGVKFHLITTGEYKGTEAGGKITDAYIEHRQELVNTYFEFFINAIERGRNMSRADIMPSADGKLFVGKQGVDNGLVDGIQSFQATALELVRSINPTSNFSATDESDRLSLLIKQID